MKQTLDFACIVFSNCDMCYCVHSILADPSPPLGEEFSVQPTRKLTYTIKKTFVINEEGYIIFE